MPVDPTPSAKTVNVTAGAAIVVILSYIITLTTNVELPDPVRDAAVVLVVLLLGMFLPAKSGTYVNYDAKH